MLSSMPYPTNPAGSESGARRCYERALDLDPRNADAWVARGAAFANQQQLGRAAEDFTMALGALLSGTLHEACIAAVSVM